MIKTRETLVRIVVGSLLNSSLTNSELLELARELPNDLAFMEDVSRTLLRAIDQLRHVDYGKSVPSEGQSLAERERMNAQRALFDLVSKKRISKRALINLLANYMG